MAKPRRTLLLAIVVAMLGGSAPTLGVQGADETMIRALVKQYEEARNRGDAVTLAGLFVAEADQLVSSGEWRKGREAVVKGSLASSAAGGRRAFTVEVVRLIAPAVAIVDSRYDIASGDGAARRMWATWLLTRTPDGWRIAAIRNMLPAPPAPPK